MYKSPFSLIICIAALLAMPLFAGDLSAVEAEVADALAAEKAGFNARDCDAALAFWSEDAQMIVEGAVRARSRTALAQRCPRIMASLPPDLDNRKTQEETVQALSESSAFSMTHYIDGAMVIKIWRKLDEGWRIVNMHESVGNAPPPASKPKS